MKRLYILFYLLLPVMARAQHCPWDCSGLLMVKTNVTPAEFKKLSPVLVDGNKRVLIDSLYGTGKETHDSCRLFYYDDFLAYRTERIKVHHWYRYDTVYHFAKKHYVARFNFCRFDNKQLFIRFNDPFHAIAAYRYIEIPDDRRIHLHAFNRQINALATEELLQLVQPLILELGRSDLKLPYK